MEYEAPALAVVVYGKTSGGHRSHIPTTNFHRIFSGREIEDVLGPRMQGMRVVRFIVEE